MEAIKFNKVHFAYESDNEETNDVFSTDVAFSLKGIDFSVKQGEFVAVLGHNGSGKSTLARLTNGLLSPDSGDIQVLGLSVKDEENLFEIRKQVGIVFQNPDNQMVASIVEDDIAFGPENVGVPREEIGERITFALDAVGMSSFRNSTPSRLSGGQKQRIAIAAVLALKPKIMILDEATAMLDPRGRKEVMDVVLRLNREENITVLLITHFSEEALLADRAIVMHQGNIVMEGRPQDVLRRGEELEKYSLTLPRSIRLCRELTAGGLSVSDGITAEEISNNILKALSLKDIENKKTMGACTRSMPSASQLSEEITPEMGRVSCRNLHYVYNARSPFATYALDGIDLEINAGEFFGIIGHTGSGKSTFVQHLNALLKLPTANKKYKEKKVKKNQEPMKKTVLYVDGFDLTDKNTDFKELRSKVGMVFQYPEYQLFAETVFEDVAFGLKNFKQDMTEAQVKTAVREALEAVGLNYNEIKKRSPFELSGGQKRRVAIAGVLVTKPEILVLDEPAAGLDPLGKEEIMQLLHNIHEKWCKTVIIVSHDMDEIAENCTSAAIFSEGKILSVNAPKELFHDVKCIEAAGLSVPFIAKIVQRLAEKGVEIDCDYTLSDFVEKMLAFYKMEGACTRLTEGGEANE
ncbi:MAG: energy-coupling factor transporter ATPase [Clostridiales bacterium]|nr:energy-coupling factor transporter ATPase [Clostridiales bacterium]